MPVSRAVTAIDIEIRCNGAWPRESANKKRATFADAVRPIGLDANSGDDPASDRRRG
ncbi:hypothetical protein [uncultured Methylobacterium sp.]|uniref:hypothetical protein n=1 Tax=uncultured Methylobacterium sp. TaxID=157278 RepID=UPI0035CB9B45